INNDHNIGPAYPSEIVGLWFIYFLIRLIQGNKFAFVVLSFLFGMMFSVHLVLLPLVFVWAIIFVLKKPIKLDLKLTAYSLVAFAIPTLPQLLFEFRHNFVHILSLIKTLGTTNPEYQYNFFARVAVVFKQVFSFFYSVFDSKILPWWLGIVVFVLITYLIYQRGGEFSKSYHRLIFLLTFTVVALYYLIYPRHVPEYYFLALAPLGILYVSALVKELFNRNFGGKVIVGLFISVVLFSNLKTFYDVQTSPVKFALNQKDQAVKAMVDHQRGKGEFSVSFMIPRGREFGFQYFFTLYNLEPRDYVGRKPPVYTIVMPHKWVSDQDLSATFGDIGIIFPEKEQAKGQQSPP
ncbi:hypothetical protein HY389_01610, partial [Candidatus Daviesbacteria bacterium]|nr:hypothetical protein [Candidatus Daviesbacteria bacterium]